LSGDTVYWGITIALDVAIIVLALATASWVLLLWMIPALLLAIWTLRRRRRAEAAKRTPVRGHETTAERGTDSGAR